MAHRIRLRVYWCAFFIIDMLNVKCWNSN